MVALGYVFDVAQKHTNMSGSSRAGYVYVLEIVCGLTPGLNIIQTRIHQNSPRVMALSNVIHVRHEPQNMSHMFVCVALLCCVCLFMFVVCVFVVFCFLGLMEHVSSCAHILIFRTHLYVVFEGPICTWISQHPIH